MNRLASLLLMAALAGATGCASSGHTGMLSPEAPRALPAQGPVSVAWADPAGFAEFRFSSNRWAAAERLANESISSSTLRGFSGKCWPCSAMNFSKSSIVTLPPPPVPAIPDRSAAFRPSSCIRAFIRGER